MTPTGWGGGMCRGTDTLVQFLHLKTCDTHKEKPSDILNMQNN